jgi:hypothetical protein
LILFLTVRTDSLVLLLVLLSVQWPQDLAWLMARILSQTALNHQSSNHSALLNISESTSPYSVLTAKENA